MRCRRLDLVDSIITGTWPGDPARRFIEVMHGNKISFCNVVAPDGPGELHDVKS